MSETAADDPSEPLDADEQSPVQSRKPLIAIAVVAILLLLALGLWLSFRETPAQLQGMVDADEVRISSKVTGRIESFAVKEGQRVKAGQTLYMIDSPEVAAKRQQAQGSLDAARALQDKADDGARPQEIRATEAQWRRVQAAANLAQTTYERTQRLYGEGVVSRQRRDEARTNAKASSEAANAARAQYDLAVAGARSEDKAAAGGQVLQAKGGVAEVDAALDETIITAPSSGEIGQKFAEVGELVPAGFPVFTLTDVANPWVTLNLREDQFAGLKMGAVFDAIVPALEDKKISLRVSFIAPTGEFATWRATRQSSGFDIKSFEVRMTPVNRVRNLRPGMSVLFDWPQ